MHAQERKPEITLYGRQTDSQLRSQGFPRLDWRGSRDCELAIETRLSEAETAGLRSIESFFSHHRIDDCGLAITGSLGLFVSSGVESIGCSWFSRGMPLPYRIATLLCCFNEQDEVLLLQRKLEPNLGCWSPCGGKLLTEIGESPYVCACREAREEIGLMIAPSELHLTGLISEHGYEGQAHWLMFLFEVNRRLKSLPPPNREGAFEFFPRRALGGLNIPETDRERIWPLFWRHRGGFFAAHCHCHPDGRNEWTVEEATEP